MAEFRLTGSRLVVRGDLDGDSEGELRDSCRQLVAGGSDSVTVDLSKVRGLNSACVGTLLALWIELRDAGRRGRIAPSSSVARMLEMTGLAEVLLKPPAGPKAADGGEGGGAEGEGSERGRARRAKF